MILPAEYESMLLEAKTIIERLTKERDHYRQRLLEMPDVNLAFKYKEEREAWIKWKKKTFSRMGIPMSIDVESVCPPTPQDQSAASAARLHPVVGPLSDTEQSHV